MFIVKVKGGYYLDANCRITPVKRDAFRYLASCDAQVAAIGFKILFNKKAKVRRI